MLLPSVECPPCIPTSTPEVARPLSKQEIVCSKASRTLSANTYTHIHNNIDCGTKYMHDYNFYNHVGNVLRQFLWKISLDAIK